MLIGMALSAHAFQRPQARMQRGLRPESSSPRAGANCLSSPAPLGGPAPLQTVCKVSQTSCNRGAALFVETGKEQECSGVSSEVCLCKHCRALGRNSATTTDWLVDGNALDWLVDGNALVLSCLITPATGTAWHTSELTGVHKCFDQPQASQYTATSSTTTEKNVQASAGACSPGFRHLHEEA